MSSDSLIDDRILAEITEFKSVVNEIGNTVGLLSIKSANQVVIEASQRPDPTPLWLSLWYENEVCCLFADSNLGKSIYAVQIAAYIATDKKVLYCDFELSDKQFQLRYTGDNGELYEFPDNLYRVEINREHLDVSNFEEAIISSIEEIVIDNKAKVVIIDNLSYLCSATEKGDEAGYLMMQLVSLKRRYDLSILVIAHTPKRQLSSPITQNDLAGSKKLFNFFDSVFAIGRSAKDSSLRYVKQIKVRSGEHIYDADNVIVYSIEKIDSFLQFVEVGFGEEREHLREPNQEDREVKINEAKHLKVEGKTQREIASIMGISVGCVNKYLQL